MSYVEVIKRKARKAHSCHWCREPILKGEEYTLHEGVQENEHSRTKLHNECAAALHDIPAGDWEDYDVVWGVGQRGHRHETGWGFDPGCTACKKEKADDQR